MLLSGRLWRQRRMSSTRRDIRHRSDAAHPLQPGRGEPRHSYTARTRVPACLLRTGAGHHLTDTRDGASTVSSRTSCWGKRAAHASQGAVTSTGCPSPRTLDFSRNRPIPVRESQGQDAGHNTLFCWSAQTHSGPKLVRVDEGRGRLLRQTTPVLVFDVSISLRVPDMRVQDARELRSPLNQRVVKLLRKVADAYHTSVGRRLGCCSPPPTPQPHSWGSAWVTSANRSPGGDQWRSVSRRWSASSCSGRSASGWSEVESASRCRRPASSPKAPSEAVARITTAASSARLQTRVAGSGPASAWQN